MGGIFVAGFGFRRFSAGGGGGGGGLVWFCTSIDSFFVVGGSIIPYSFGICFKFSNFLSLKLYGNSWWNLSETISISNKDPSFHLWQMKNLVKYQKVSKYYDYRCRH